MISEEEEVEEKPNVEYTYLPPNYFTNLFFSIFVI